MNRDRPFFTTYAGTAEIAGKPPPPYQPANPRTDPYPLDQPESARTRESNRACRQSPETRPLLSEGGIRGEDQRTPLVVGSIFFFGIVIWLVVHALATSTLDVYWIMPIDAKSECAGYGSREYTAVLNIESFSAYHWHTVCMKQAPEIVIHGRTLQSPDYCDMQGGRVIGHWTVDFDEPECTSSWGWFLDRGCTSSGSGFRFFEAELHGHLDGDTWREMCRLTPAVVRNVEFPGAMRCYDWGKKGKWGAWDIADESCA
ncbi:hypothetical protein EV714DRAFT_233741 [Schizophyllum commune]